MCAFEPGKRISAGELNRAADGAAVADGVTGGGLNVKVGPRGVSIVSLRKPKDDPNCVEAEFTDPCLDIGSASCDYSSDMVPLFGVVEVYNAYDTEYSKVFAMCRIPSQSGFACIGSVQNGATPNEAVTVQTKGYGHVLFDLSTVPAALRTTVRYRLGCRKNSFYAQYDMLGPLELVKDMGAVDGDVHLGAVQFTGNRGDTKLVETGGRADGAYETIIWDHTFTVTEESFGNIRIDLA